MSDRQEGKLEAVPREYWISDPRGGGCAEPFALFEAVEAARQMSIDSSCAIFVTRDLTYTPEIIYFCGREYRPVEGE